MEYYKNLSLEDLFYIDDDGLVCCEEWKDIIGYNELYLISNLGRLKTLSKDVIVNGVFKRRRKEKILKQVLTAQGYLQIGLHNSCAKKMFKVHRLVAIAFIPNPENKPQVNHKKGIKSHNIYSELEWNTSTENVQHSYDLGLRAGGRGEKSCNVKLNNKQVLEIRNIGKSIMQKDIAKIYNIDKSVISSILRRKTWNHI